MKKLVVLAIVFASAVSCADSEYNEVLEVENLTIPFLTMIMMIRKICRIVYA